ncbi:hypothetical protein [Niabella soli]|nr:hypothetical protein [Niabella soli]
MRLNKSILLFFVLIFSLSCNGISQADRGKNELDSQYKHPVDFLDKKYSSKYQLIIDESNISDHPFFSYLDCKKEGYFVVHYVPKSIKLRNFWKSKFYENTRLDTYDFDKDDQKIRSLLNKDLKSYNIFCVYLSTEELDSNGDCTKETVHAKKDAISLFYIYNQDDGKWTELKRLKIVMLPPYVNDSFFVRQFPAFFNVDNSNVKIPNNIYGFCHPDIRTDTIKSETCYDIKIQDTAAIVKGNTLEHVGEYKLYYTKLGEAELRNSEEGEYVFKIRKDGDDYWVIEKDASQWYKLKKE